MDTILFFYLSRKQETGCNSHFCVKHTVREDYCLIRIGVEKELLEEDEALQRWQQVTSDDAPGRELLERCRRELLQWLWPFLQGREPLDEWGWECETALESLICRIWGETGAAEEYSGEMEDKPAGNIRSRWKQRFLPEIPRFCHYKSSQWVRRFCRSLPESHGMLRKGNDRLRKLPCSGLLILDTCRAVGEMLLPLAQQLKTLTWIVPEEAYETAERELVEELELEYGLLVNLTLLKEEAYRRCLLHSAQPVVIWDFSMEEKPWVTDLPECSSWYDFTGNGRKQSHIQRRNSKIHYFSLKKQWGEP